MTRRRSKTHIAFEIGVILKGINGLIELIAGFLLLVGAGHDSGLVLRPTRNELSEDPRDFVATRLREAAAHLSANAQLFAAIYVLAHGVIKALLVYGLLRDRLWAFPTGVPAVGSRPPAMTKIILLAQESRLRSARGASDTPGSDGFQTLLQSAQVNGWRLQKRNCRLNTRLDLS